MIEKIINTGEYVFDGDIKDLKRCLSSFKIIKVTCDGELLGVKFCEVLGRFRYHGENHLIHVSKHWGGENKLFITYKGVENV